MLREDVVSRLLFLRFSSIIAALRCCCTVNNKSQARTPKPLIRVVLLVFLSQLLLSCSVNKRVSYSDEEGRLPEELIHKIKRKKTEKSWVLAHLGEPFAIDRVETDEAAPRLLADVYTFRFQKETAQTGHVFYFLRARGLEQSTEYLHIAFENDVVKKSWMDDFPRPQIGARIRHAKVNTVRVKPDVKKVSVQPTSSATNWKIPILKKWLSPQDLSKYSEEQNEELDDASSEPPASLETQPAESEADAAGK